MPLLFGLLIVGLSPFAPVAAGTYEVTVAGTACTQQQSGQRDCEYRVGQSLRFAIAAVGEADAAITIFKSDFDGDFFASVGVLHGCVIVKPGQSGRSPGDFAFVSPWNGRVYRDWRECMGAAQRREP